MMINVHDFYQKVQKGEFEHWLDVRSAAEFHSERADCTLTKNHPLDKLDSLDLAKDAEIYVSCRTGARSAKAQKRLQELGFSHVINIEGGYLAWQAAGLPTTKTKGQFPIMRQVQMVAGALILLGSLGSLYITPDLIWLAAFVGAGLTFAGASGWCGMALMLGAMPWNKK
ncbi:MAG: rhodanese-like domain-containing protein [Mariprofundaceae bacterium]|nr:rhodanese-like domain-containing protein [Mariprofundaceae bacterium]